MNIIGVDIGGTHTDAVLVDREQNLLAYHKAFTTDPLELGFRNVLSKLIKKGNIDLAKVGGVHLGTTHATNAILQKQGLRKVGILRLAGHAPMTLPPCYDWPTALSEAALREVVTINGGFECDGRPITALFKNEVEEAIQKLIDAGAQAIAVIGIFSPLKNEQELLVADILGDRVPISLSHEIGGIGLIERENATVLNAALIRIMKEGLGNLNETLISLGFQCPLMITQNNGSLISLQQAIKYPILTISSGQTNSFVGGAKLAKCEDAIVVDIGGTSTDIGRVKSGFPCRTIESAIIGGVNLNFPMPDVLSVALGGGSPLYDSYAFGGKTLTLTDVALKFGHLSIPSADASLIPLSKSEAEVRLREVVKVLDELTRSVNPMQDTLPVLLVGGGSSLIPQNFLPSRFRQVSYGSIANAFGASLAEIAAKSDLIVSLNEREKVLADLIDKTKERAALHGACPEKVRITDIQIIPYHYMPGNQARVIISAAGPKK